MWATLMLWDLEWLRLINGAWTHPVLDWVMAVVSDFGLFKIPLVLGVVTLLALGRFRERLFVVLTLLCVIVGDMGMDAYLKHAVGRPRPYQYLEQVRMVDRSGVRWSQPSAHPHGNSFPSGHAYNNVAIALVGTLLYGRWAWWLWPWAALVSYSRIYNGSHHPSDVLFSWVVGVVLTWCLLKLVEGAWQRWGARWVPSLYANHPRLIFTNNRTIS